MDSEGVQAGYSARELVGMGALARELRVEVLSKPPRGSANTLLGRWPRERGGG